MRTLGEVWQSCQWMRTAQQQWGAEAESQPCGSYPSWFLLPPHATLSPFPGVFSFLLFNCLCLCLNDCIVYTPTFSESQASLRGLELIRDENTSIYFLTWCFSSGFQIVVHTQWDYYRLLQEPALLAFISTYKGTFSSSEWLPHVHASSLYFVHRTPTL